MVSKKLSRMITAGDQLRMFLKEQPIPVLYRLNDIIQVLTRVFDEGGAEELAGRVGIEDSEVLKEDIFIVMMLATMGLVEMFEAKGENNDGLDGCS